MYYILYGFLYLISLLPFFILYGIADFIFLILFYVVGYRKEVVMDNLKQAFPEKGEAELKKIRRKFFRNFIDNWIETIKLLSISKRAFEKRVTSNAAILSELHKNGLPVQLNTGHFINWEIAGFVVSLHQPYPYLYVYLPQANKAVDRLMKTIRSRMGGVAIPSTDMVRSIIPWRKKQYLLGLIADQNQSNVRNGYWCYFLNRPTIFSKGPEKFARAQNLPVVMLTTTRPRRGHYHFEFSLATTNPKSLPDGELMRLYVKHLENNIRLQPDLYLWSHKRWKHEWHEDLEDLWVDALPSPTKA